MTNDEDCTASDEIRLNLCFISPSEPKKVINIFNNMQLIDKTLYGIINFAQARQVSCIG